MLSLFDDGVATVRVAAVVYQNAYYIHMYTSVE